MADTTLDIVVRARDEASKSLEKTEGALSKLGSAAAGVGKAVLTFGAAAAATAVAIGVKGVKDYSEAERASAMLEHAVIGVTHATQDQLQATSALADQLEKKGVLDGDNIKMGLAQLSTFGLSNEAVRALGGSLADLAVNQYGVSASGEQLSDTANTIAKALNGQFGVLEKSGIRFTEAQQHAIKFGTEMQKVTAINEGFAQNLKYTNEVASQTTEGAFAKMNVVLGNMSEAIGGVLAPIVSDFVVNRIVPLMEKILAAIPTVEQLKATFNNVRDAFVKAMTDFDAKTGIITQVRDGFAKVWSTVQEKLVPSLEKLWVAIQPLMPAFEALAKVVGAVLVLSFKAILALFIEAVDLAVKIIAKWADMVAFISSILAPAFNMLKGALDSVANGIEWVISKFDAMKNAAVNAFNVAKNAVASIPGVSAIASIIPGKAAGGPVMSGQPYVVGEKGPELFVPEGNGTIIPNGKSSGGQAIGGTSVNISIGSFFGGNPERAAREIGDLIIKRLQVNARVA